MLDYSQILSERVQTVKPSGIRKFFDLAAGMKDVISLGVGEPDFETPWQVRRAGITSLEKGRTFYTSNWGLQQLRDEIAGLALRRYDLFYDPQDEILVTVGGSEAIVSTVDSTPQSQKPPSMIASISSVTSKIITISQSHTSSQASSGAI